MAHIRETIGIPKFGPSVPGKGKGLVRKPLNVVRKKKKRMSSDGIVMI